MASKHNFAEHHIKAAEHREQTARHYREAAKQHEAGAHGKGAPHDARAPACAGGGHADEHGDHAR